MSVSADHSFPLFQQAYSGNTTDEDIYVEQRHNLIDLPDRDDFLFVVDSKTDYKREHDPYSHQLWLLFTPTPVYETYKNAFHDAVNQYETEILIPYKKRINRGFEAPLLIEQNDKT